MDKVVSKISGREITQAQYITELVCSRRYKKEEGVEAKAGFWATSEKWTDVYRQQITRANALLRMYDYFVIIRVLERESWMYSLYTKKLNADLLAEQKKTDKKHSVLKDKEINVEEVKVFRTKQGNKGKTKLGKLRDME